MGGLNISPFVAICRAVELAELPEAQCGIPDPMGWSEADLGQAVTDLDSLDRRLERVGDLAVHPWRHTGLTTAPLTVRQALEEKRAALATGVARVRELAAALAESLGLDPSATVAGIAGQVEEGNRLAEAPQIPASVLAHLGWKSDGGREDWLAAGSRYVEQRGGWSVEMIDEAEELDWGETLSRRRSQHASVLRFFRWSWYADGKRIREHHRDGVLPPIGKQLDLLQALVACRRARNHVRSEEARQAEPFGDFWQGLHSDWQALRRLADSVPAFQRRMDAGHLGRQATEAILGSADRGRLTDLLRQADDALEVARAAWVAWVEAVQAEAESWIGSAWDGVSLAEVSARLDEIAERFDTLQDWADYRAVEQPLRAGKARGFLDWAESEGGAVARGQLGRTFLRHLYRLWIDEAFQQRATLAGFSGEDHQDLIERFAAADRGWISGMRGQLAGQIRTHRPDMSYAAHKTSKLGIVQAEIRKKRRHMPLRRLLSTAGEVIQAIKPCLMMSPISVAQYLEPGGLEFDVVIFDEASQVEPADAYGAIARGSQVVLVGDENQLPPTSFFSRVQSDGPPAEGEELGAGDLESILSLGVVRLPHRCRLRWHYRSRYESLIRFSSDEFYDGDLRIFPSPHTGCEVMGLTFRHVADGVYMRGQGQHNPREASVVAQAVLAHALETPQLTLGVGAFSVQQQRAIEDEIERLRREHADPKREAFFLSHEDEPFFVKNLETIQGDERDVIFLSVGYGPDPSGRLTMNFGPLNRDGGWRRLNVLVTRSRRRCVCFSSIRADDIDLGRTRALGVTALKRYLHTAEHGQLGDDRDAVGDQELEAVQVDLCSALEAAGWETRTRVGVGGFAIDIAVVDPDHPERYLVGIECDGESYRSVFTARDRDRLRRQVLEALGWRVERVWSVDWFKRREETLAALLGKLNNARREPRRYEEIAPPAGHASGSQPADEVVDFGESPEPVRLAPTKPEDVIPYYRRRRELLGNHEALVSAAVLRVVALIGQVVADEAPVHVDEVLRVLTGLYRTRATKRPRAVFEEALELTLERGLALRRGDFLWRSANQAIPVRRRDGDCPVTRAELIAPEELGEAVKIVVGRAFGIKQDALVESTARLLGFSRLGKKIAIVIGAAVTNLIASGAIVTDDQGFLQLRSDP